MHVSRQKCAHVKNYSQNIDMTNNSDCKQRRMLAPLEAENQLLCACIFPLAINGTDLFIYQYIRAVVYLQVLADGFSTKLKSTG
jgi:hypothetical protein